MDFVWQNLTSKFMGPLRIPIFQVEKPLFLLTSSLFIIDTDMIGGNPCCIGVGIEAQYHLGGFGSHSFQCAFCSLGFHGLVLIFSWRLVGAECSWIFLDVWWINTSQLFG